MLGRINLYPEGTKRVVNKLTINGWKLKRQKASIKFVCNNDGVIYYNKWI